MHILKTCDKSHFDDIFRSVFRRPNWAPSTGRFEPQGVAVLHL